MSQRPSISLDENEETDSIITDVQDIFLSKFSSQFSDVSIKSTELSSPQKYKSRHSAYLQTAVRTMALGKHISSSIQNRKQSLGTITQELNKIQIEKQEITKMEIYCQQQKRNLAMDLIEGLQHSIYIIFVLIFLALKCYTAVVIVISVYFTFAYQLIKPHSVLIQYFAKFSIFTMEFQKNGYQVGVSTSYTEVQKKRIRKNLSHLYQSVTILCFSILYAQNLQKNDARYILRLVFSPLFYVNIFLVAYNVYSLYIEMLYGDILFGEKFFQNLKNHLMLFSGILVQVLTFFFVITGNSSPYTFIVFCAALIGYLFSHQDTQQTVNEHSNVAMVWIGCVMYISDIVLIKYTLLLDEWSFLSRIILVVILVLQVVNCYYYFKNYQKVFDLNQKTKKQIEVINRNIIQAVHLKHSQKKEIIIKDLVISIFKGYLQYDLAKWISEIDELTNVQKAQPKAKPQDYLNMGISQIMKRQEPVQQIFYDIIMYIFESQQYFDILNLEKSAFQKYIKEVARIYLLRDAKFNNIYRSIDLIIRSYQYLITYKVNEKILFNELEVASMIFAAAISHFNHFGVNNEFLIKNEHDVSILYNEHAPNENHSLYTAFKLMLENKHLNFTNNFSSGEFKLFRATVINLIIGTDKEYQEEIMNYTQNSIVSGKWSEKILNEQQLSVLENKDVVQKQQNEKKLHILQLLFNATLYAFYGYISQDRDAIVQMQKAEIIQQQQIETEVGTQKVVFNEFTQFSQGQKCFEYLAKIEPIFKQEYNVFKQ